jgi:putative transcriptional regulator
MAFAIGTCPKTICNIEKGYYCPTLETALRLAKYLDVSVEQLFVLDESVEAVKPMQ